jgi:hypothetical protein
MFCRERKTCGNQRISKPKVPLPLPLAIRENPNEIQGILLED